MSKLPTLKSLDTELAFASRSVPYDPDLKSPNSKTPSAGCSKTPISAFSKTPSSAFPKTPISAIPDPRMIVRQTTHRDLDAALVDQTEALAYDGGEDGTLIRMGNLLHKIHSTSVLVRYTLYILRLATLLAVPLGVTGCPPHDETRADGIRLLGLFISIEIAWLAFWFSKLTAKVLPVMFQAACGLVSTETLEWQRTKAEKAEKDKQWIQESVESLLPSKDASPAQAIFPGLKKRNAGQQDEGVGRRPSFWSPM